MARTKPETRIDKALSELKKRGYNAVRIDAYPHLVAESPDIKRVNMQPNLNRFIAKCREYDIKVGLPSWFRKDADNTRMKITSAEKHAEIWIKTLQSIEKEGLLDNLLYADLCNEWPGDLWASYFKNDPPHLTLGYWHTDSSMKWMKTAIELVRKQFPQIPLNYSFDNLDVEKYSERDLSFFDFAEHHIWMVKENNGEFYREVKERSRTAGRPVDIDGLFSNQVYKNLVAEYEAIYYEKPEYWKKLLTDKIKLTADHAAKANLPLITTECWGIVDYKDWPLLKWDWVKELCELGVKTAASTGQWIAPPAISVVLSLLVCGAMWNGTAV